MDTCCLFLFITYLDIVFDQDINVCKCKVESNVSTTEDETWLSLIERHPNILSPFHSPETDRHVIVMRVIIVCIGGDIHRLTNALTKVFKKVRLQIVKNFM